MAETKQELASRARRLAGFACTQEDRTRLLEIAATFEREARFGDALRRPATEADPINGTMNGRRPGV